LAKYLYIASNRGIVFPPADVMKILRRLAQAVLFAEKNLAEIPLAALIAVANAVRRFCAEVWLTPGILRILHSVENLRKTLKGTPISLFLRGMNVKLPLCETVIWLAIFCTIVIALSTLFELFSCPSRVLRL